MLCDAAAVVGLRNEVPDGIPGNLRRILVQVHSQDILTNVEVGVVEVVANVPSQHLELLSLEQNSMEPAEREEEPPVLLGLFHAVVMLLGGILQQAHQVGLQTFRWLCCHLDAVLQQLDRELRRRRRGHEDAELFGWPVVEGFLDQLLERRQPVHAEVAVCKQDPEALLCTVQHHLLRFRLLALTQGDRLPLQATSNSQSAKL
mmetsp:Transcript_46558/g.109070  ORF Transcript_46558/g.109070 Transcript_46558/m.109070 type:complete len:203 (-) Transcript_46558:2274-2882(-)